MKQKRITLKDIARECNCSVATVSYVLNDVKDQKISEEKRTKILQMVNLYGYRVNLNAKSLITGDVLTHTILFLYSPNTFSLYQAEVLSILNSISSKLEDKQFNLAVSSDITPKKYQNVDAVICFNISTDEFKNIANLNYVPLIALDTVLEDPIFYKIKNNINNLAKDKHYVSLKYNDQIKALFKGYDITFIDSYDDIRLLNRDKSYIVLQKCLFNYLKSIDYSVELNDFNNDVKIDKLISVILDLIKQVESTDNNEIII